MPLGIKFICGMFMVLATFLFYLRAFHNSRPEYANAEQPRPKWKPGRLGRLINRCALVSVVLLLLPLDNVWLA